MSACIFCKIVAGEIPAKKVHEDDAVVGFRDLNPQAPNHVLVIPRKHVASLDDLSADDALLAGRMILGAQKIAKQLDANGGYRLVLNTGPDAGQTVFHIHLHVLSGRPFAWPPG